MAEEALNNAKDPGGTLIFFFMCKASRNSGAFSIARGWCLSP